MPRTVPLSPVFPLPMGERGIGRFYKTFSIYSIERYNVRYPVTPEFTSTREERETDLFFQIADIIDFTPERYDQESWGEFTPTDEDQQKWADTYGTSTTDAPWTSQDSKWQEIGCGSKMCVAGWAANLNGYLPHVLQREDQRFNDGRMVYTLDWGTVNKRKHLTEVGLPTESVSEVAKELLGITGDEADILFHAEYIWTGADLRAFGKGETIVWEGPVDGDDDE